jgi:hypothetical protein
MGDGLILTGSHPLEYISKYVRMSDTWVVADPVQPLWNTPSALLPQLKPEILGYYAPQLKHITAWYKERPRKVACTVNGVNYLVRVDQEYTIKHTLVICRYCKRVAEYSWNEVRAFDSAILIPDEDEITARYVTTAWYDGYDDVNVSLVDKDVDGSDVNIRDVPHGLFATAYANPWGWFIDPTTPGNIPTLPVVRQDSMSARYTTVSYTVVPGHTESTLLLEFYNPITGTVYASGTKHRVNDNPGAGSDPQYWYNTYVISEDYSTYPLGSPSGGPDISVVTKRITGYAYTGTDGSRGEVWNDGGLTWADAISIPNPLYAENIIFYEEWIAAIGVYLDKIIALIQTIPSLLKNKLLTDVTELTPLSYIPYMDQKAAYIMPVEMTCTVTASLMSVSKDFELVTNHPILTVFGAERSEVCGATVTLKTPTIQPPYVATIQPPVTFKFDTALKTFTLSTDKPLTYKKAYFSSGTDLTKLEATPFGEMRWGGMYHVSASPAAIHEFHYTLEPCDDEYHWGVDPANLMQKMCIDLPSFPDVTYVAYSAIFTKRGAAYRQMPHTYVRGDLSVVQAAIPNTDAP